jgi:hypothetical protein
MNIPVNFRKINNTTFITNGIKFRIETDSMQDGSVWIFEDANDNDKTFSNCLFFNFNWSTQSYIIRRCELGNGTIGDDIVGSTTFVKKDVESKTSFVDDFLYSLTEWTISTKLFY